MNEAIEKIAKRLESYNIRYNREKIAREILEWDLKPLGYSLPDPDRLTRISDEEINKHGYGWMQNYDYEIKELLDAQLQHDRETLEKK